jgi:urease accessory protein
LNARLALRFESSDRGTQLQVDTQQPPWKVVRAFKKPNGGALVHLHNLSGGVLAGDCLSLEIDVGADAVAQVTSTGATRLYRHRAGASDSEQRTTISVAENGLLEYLPDALIPFAGSRHVQRTTVTLANRASFFWWEVLAPGRQAMGELFAFERLRVETLVRSHHRPLIIENFLLEPGVRLMQSEARLGSYLYTASFCAIQVGRTAADLRMLEGKLSDVAREASRPGVMIWGASALASDGVMVRGLSATARDLPATLVRFWNTARQFLTGEEAVPPRKMK